MTLIKKILFSVIFNSSLLTILFLGIQNSSNKNKVDFFFDKTVPLPISFIVGISFISGSFLGSFLKITDVLKKSGEN